MSGAEVLAALHAAGFTLHRDGDRLGVSSREALTPELRAAIIEHKAELLALLAPAPVRLWWDEPPWNGQISDAEHAVVVDADIREQGYYVPSRNYSGDKDTRCNKLR